MRDKTEQLRRHLTTQLQPGEEVLAGVGVSLHGSAAASMSGAATASDGIPTFVAGGQLPKAMANAEKSGLSRWPHWFAVLTSQRLMVVRRSAFNRPKQTQLSVPLSHVETLKVSTPNVLKLAFADGRRIRFETPKHLKFLPPVYERLPTLLAEARERDET